MKSEINSHNQITQLISLVDSLFHDGYSGMYLYGSATFGGLRPNSDIDILIIIKEKISNYIRKKLTEHLLIISGTVGCIKKRPLEVTFICQSDIIPWRFPPKCEYVFGEWLRSEIEAGHEPLPHNNPDLTILLWQAKRYGLLLKGKKIDDLVPSIPFSEIQKAIKYSLPQLMNNLNGDERNVLLTLARMWFTLETGEISTKDIAAQWVLEKIPNQSSSILNMAKEAYLGNVQDQWECVKKETLILAKFMQYHIETLSSSV